MSVIVVFMRWWNALAAKNGKLKFRNQREAADFVRRVHNENGGPNAKIIALRRAYEEATKAKSANDPAGVVGHRRSAVH